MCGVLHIRRHRIFNKIRMRTPTEGQKCSFFMFVAFFLRVLNHKLRYQLILKKHRTNMKKN